jgi:hypothetical protein
MPKQRRLNNYQSRLAQLFFLTGLLSLVILLFSSANIIDGLIVLVPVATFFATHMFFLVRRQLIDLITSLLFVLFAVLISYDSELKIFGLINSINQEQEVEKELVSFIEGKKMMVLGDHKHLYAFGSLATPFYDWSLSKPILDHLEYYDNIVFIKESLDRYRPEIILDYELTWRKITSHIPEFNLQYREVRPFVWVRKK